MSRMAVSHHDLFSCTPFATDHDFQAGFGATLTRRRQISLGQIAQWSGGEYKRSVTPDSRQHSWPEVSGCSVQPARALFTAVTSVPLRLSQQHQHGADQSRPAGYRRGCPAGRQQLLTAGRYRRLRSGLSGSEVTTRWQAPR